MKGFLLLLWAACVHCVPAPHRTKAPPPPGPRPSFPATWRPHKVADVYAPKPALDTIPDSNTSRVLISETLCVDDPATFVCKWIGPSGDIVDSASRPGVEYLQVAGTTGLMTQYHQTGTEIVRKSVRNMNPEIFYTVARDARLGLFTDEDKTTIFPEYVIYRDTPECAGRCDNECAITCTGDGRKYDSLAGVGGVRATCVDDNFMCLPSDPYGNTYSVLIHEWGHTVHQYGLDLYWYNAINNAYQTALAQGTWDPSSYAMSNALEYFAEATGVWFNVNFHPTASGGMNSCGKGPYQFCDSELDARWWLYEQDIEVYTCLLHIWNDYDSVATGDMTVCP